VNVATPLVRGGVDDFLIKRPDRDEPGHTLLPVYGEMFLQICQDYHSLPDPRTLTLAEMRYFYSGLRSGLKQHTKPQTTVGKPSITRRTPRRRR
jgi:hypothetical protein